MSEHPGVRSAFERLNRLRTAAPHDEERIVEGWAVEMTQPDIPDEVAHFAMAVRDMFRAGRQSVAAAMRRTLVIVLHGIRDHGTWLEMVRSRLTSPSTVVQPLDYEFYNVVRFITGLGARGVISRVTDAIRDAIATQPGCEVVIIAHSFGTYVVSNILLQNPDIRCARAVFCGAVVSKRFAFRRLTQQIQIINECGDRDIYPVLAQGFGVFARYSASGVWGLRQARIHDRFHDFQHSDYLRPEFVDRYWKPFVERGEIIPTEYETARRDVPWGVSMLSFGWRLVLLLAMFICGILYCSQNLRKSGNFWSAGMVDLCSMVLVASLVVMILVHSRRFHFPVGRS